MFTCLCPIRSMAHTSRLQCKPSPLLHLCHVTSLTLALLSLTLYITCPHFHISLCTDLSNCDTPYGLSPLIPPASVCQCLDGLYSSLWLGSWSSQCCSESHVTNYFHASHHRSSLLIHLLLLLAGDIKLNPGPFSNSTSLSFACLNIRSAASISDALNKPCTLQEFITDHELEILSLTETWLAPDSPTNILNSLTPDNYSIIHNPRLHGKGGGIAVIFRSYLKATIVPAPVFTSFESFCIRFSFSSHSFTLLTVYRPPSSSLATFISDFSSLLTDLASTPSELVICGDFNIHVDNRNAPGVTSFLNILSTFGLSQHINFPTHISGHTLDLLISQSSSQCIHEPSHTYPALSDHHAILAQILFPIKLRSPKIIKPVRSLRKINYTELNNDILSSALYTSPTSDLTTYLNIFRDTMSTLLNKHAPVKNMTCKLTPDKPFITAEIKAQKAKRSRLETIYRKTRTVQNHEKFKQQSHLVAKLITNARRDYYRSLISKQSAQPRKLWNTLNTLLSRSSRPTLPSPSSPLSCSSLATSFLTFFNDKITKLQMTLPTASLSPHLIPPTPPPGLSDFRLASSEEIKGAILASSDATCPLDFIPTVVLKSCLETLLQPITTLINLCLTESTFPSCFKTALVKPLLKKYSLPKDDLSSYRPISNLNFLSKLLERIMHNRLLTHLNSFPSISPFQSAYRKFHSVETALLRIQNDLLLAMDRRQVSALILLDLSAAFDTLDHNILLTRLSSTFGISGSALALLTSYISNRNQYVSIGNDSSVPTALTTGVPQGSVLGPLLFTLYTTPISYLLQDSHMSFHLYADDTQLYIAFSPQHQAETLSRLSSTLDLVHSWLTSNRLVVNPSKTEYLIIGSKQQCAKISLPTVNFKGNILSPTPTVRNLGVTLDSDLSLTKHISSICSSSFYIIRQIRQIRASLDQNTCVLLCNALVSSKLDYCNSIYYGLPQSSVHRLQLVQNALARVVSPSVKRHDHISPTLRKLHWLPIQSRIIYKLALITYKTLNQNSPSYLHSLLTPYRPVRQLRSSDKLLLTVPSLKSSFGHRSFSCAGPTIWNSLPFSIRSATSIQSFRSSLKTHLFPP